MSLVDSVVFDNGLYAKVKDTFFPDMIDIDPSDYQTKCLRGLRDQYLITDNLELTSITEDGNIFEQHVNKRGVLGVGLIHSLRHPKGHEVFQDLHLIFKEGKLVLIADTDNCFSNEDKFLIFPDGTLESAVEIGYFHDVFSHYVNLIRAGKFYINDEPSERFHMLTEISASSQTLLSNRHLVQPSEPPVLPMPKPAIFKTKPYNLLYVPVNYLPEVDGAIEIELDISRDLIHTHPQFVMKYHAAPHWLRFKAYHTFVVYHSSLAGSVIVQAEISDIEVQQTDDKLKLRFAKPKDWFLQFIDSLPENIHKEVSNGSEVFTAICDSMDIHWGCTRTSTKERIFSNK